MKLFDLDGMGIGLTGGAGYLGRAMALGLADAGATVVTCDLNESSLKALDAEVAKRERRGRVITLAVDICNEDMRREFLDRIETETGAIAGWINNAYSGATGLLQNATREQIETSVVNGLARVIEITRDVANRMIPRKAGAIVNLGSMYGMVSPQPDAYVNHQAFHNPPAYGAAKAGVLQYTKYAACHLGEHGIRVNAVSPGPFPSERVRSEEGFENQLANRVPLGRVGRPDELVGAMVFLLSSASSYITGHNLFVDGGWTAW